MSGIIFVGGAGGVGKTTLSKELASLNKDFNYFNFFACMRKEAGVCSDGERLKKWQGLQGLLITNQITPLISNDASIIFDTHYSFQSDGGPEVAFAKRGFDPTVPAELTFCQNFVSVIADLKIPTIAILLRANPGEILRRRLRDLKSRPSTCLSIESIVKEQDTEESCWREFQESMERLNIALFLKKFDNVAHPTTTATLLSHEIRDFMK
ncbi:MAG: hypothetical protein ABIH39_04875 [Candidatus Margulisiibacteriota bacterium]